MSETEITTPAGVLRIEREVVEVTSNAPRRDPDWVFTDAHGHEHRWNGHDLPSLRWVADETYWCFDCNDEHDDDGHYECRECGEEITPGMRPAPGHREFLPGLTTITLDGEPISEEQAREFLATHGGA